MRTAIVTGAAGFIGSHLAYYLLKSGWRVVGVDDLSGGYRSWLPHHKNFRFVRVDLNSGTKFQQLVSREKPAVIYHLAAYAAEGLSPFVRRFNYERNLLATAAVTNAAVQFGPKIVFASSMAVYGRQETPFTEDLSRSPIDPYGIAKTSAELDLESAAQQFDIRYSIIRPHNVIGTNQNIWDRYRNVAGIFIRRALTGQPIQVFGSGKQTRAFSDVRYYLDPLRRLADAGDGEIFNLGSDKYCTVLELAEMVQDVVRRRGVETRLEHVEQRHEVFDAYCDHTKARERLGFYDETDLLRVLEEMVAWAMAQPKRRVRSLNYEVTTNLYGFWQ